MPASVVMDARRDIARLPCNVRLRLVSGNPLGGLERKRMRVANGPTGLRPAQP